MFLAFELSELGQTRMIDFRLDRSEAFALENFIWRPSAFPTPCETSPPSEPS